jgi:hypothetical protein
MFLTFKTIKLCFETLLERISLIIITEAKNKMKVSQGLNAYTVKVQKDAEKSQEITLFWHVCEAGRINNEAPVGSQTRQASATSRHQCSRQNRNVEILCFEDLAAHQRPEIYSKADLLLAIRCTKSTTINNLLISIRTVQVA